MSDGSQGKKNVQFSETERVWIDLLEKTPPCLIKRLSKSIGHVIYRALS